MRTSTLFTFVSLFLIGSYSLPQPENLEASRTIEEREARIGPDGPFPSHKEGGDWEHHHGSGSASSTSNSTKIKEREELHERPSTMPEFFEHKHHDGSGPGSSSTNSTKIKERQEHGPPSGAEFMLPEGMTWMEFKKHMKHKGGSATQSAPVSLSTGTSTETETDYSGTGTNSTKVKMMKFRD